MRSTSFLASLAVVSVTHLATLTHGFSSLARVLQHDTYSNGISKMKTRIFEGTENGENAVAEIKDATAEKSEPAKVGADAEKSAPAKVGANQAKYGNELPVPDTYAKCAKCQALFALTDKDLGTNGKGCRVECDLCDHSWFQARDKLYSLDKGFKLDLLKTNDISRIKDNIKEGRRPNFVGVGKLYVGNLDFKCTENDIMEFLQKAGEVGEVTIVRDNESGRSRGFAFVTMMTEEGCVAALDLDGEELLERNLQINRPNK